MAYGTLARALKPLLWAVLVGLAYEVLARLSERYFYYDPAKFLAFWLPSGFTLAVLVRTPRRSWPLWLAAFFSAEFLHELLYPRPLGLALALGTADSLEPFIGASLLRWAFRRRLTLSNPREVFGLVGLGALVPAMVSGVLGAWAGHRWLSASSDLLTWWTSWWIGDALAVVLAGPFFLTALPPPRLAWPRKLEAALLIVLFAGVTRWAFTAPDGPGQLVTLPLVLLALYSTFGFLVWAALGFGVPGVATAILVLAGVVGGAAGMGRGPFHLTAGDPHTGLVATQAFLATFALLSLLLAAALSERRRVERGARLLADASRLLAEGVDEHALARVAQRLVPELADACVLSVARPSAMLEPVGTAGKVAALRRLLPPRLPPAPSLQATQVRGDAEVHLTVPLQSQERTIGLLALSRSSQARSFDVEDRVLATELAQRCSLLLERTQLHQQLRQTVKSAEESLAQLDTLLQTAPIGLAVFDAQMRCERANPAFVEMAGLQGGMVQGRSAREACPSLEPLLRQVLERGWPVLDRELQGRAHEREQRLRTSAFPVRGPGGALLGVGVLVQDVTEERRAEALRTRLFQEVKASLRARDEFLTLAAHEMKTPLTPLALRLEALERRLRATQPEDARVLHSIRANLRRLQALIEHLLQSAQLDTGQLTIRVALTPLQEVVHSVAAPFAGASPRHRLEVDTGEEGVWVLADRARLEQVLTTLLENAFKYSPEGGTVRVALSHTGEEVRVAVSDPGVGIPQDELPHVFERYFRGRTSPVGSYGGLGLGLYLCRSLVEAHGGRMWVESEPGRGSTFSFALPLVRAGARLPEPAPAPPPPGAVLH